MYLAYPDVLLVQMPERADPILIGLTISVKMADRHSDPRTRGVALLLCSRVACP
jgi:hypothetical protein